MRERWRNTFQNYTAVALAVALHATLALVLVLNFDALVGSRTAPSEASAPHVVEATVVDQVRLDEELQKLIDADRRKQEEQQARQAELERAAQEAREQRQQEERRLDELQRAQAEERKSREREQARVEAERQAEQLRLEELRRQQSEAKRIADDLARAAQQEEAKRLEAEKRRQEAEREAEEAKRRAEEVARKAQEEEARRKAEQARRAEEARQAQEAARKAEEARLAEERKRLQELLAKEERERAIRDQALKDLVSRYGSLIQQRVERSWILPYEGNRDLSCMLRITLTHSGEVTRVDVVNSSGDVGFDRSAVAAVHRASPLPVPSDPDALMAFRSFNFLFNPGG